MAKSRWHFAGFKIPLHLYQAIGKAAEVSGLGTRSAVMRAALNDFFVKIGMTVNDDGSGVHDAH